MRRHKIRNPVAQSPLLKKGGAHVQSKSGQRKRIKNALKKELNDYLKEHLPRQTLRFVIKDKDNQCVILFLCADSACNRKVRNG